MPVTLLVTIDTEEEFDWSAPVSPANRSVRHARELPRLQEVFDECGARPTYVVDHPIATTDESVAVLRGFLDRGACEIGAHLHPWVNPPIDEEICPRNTYLCNLPLALQEEKLGRLTEAIETAFGRRPTTFKAGRYGLDFALVGRLAALGYTADNSVIAYTDFTHDEGPDFFRYGNDPFWLENGRGPVLEIPCTVGFSRRPFDRWARIHRWLGEGPLRRLRPVGVLWHAGLLRRIVLTPEGTNAADLIKLLKVMGQGAESADVVLNITLHSPSIEPGHTPYVRTRDELTAFLESLRRTLRFAVEELGARCMTLAEYRRQFNHGDTEARRKDKGRSTKDNM